MNILKNLYHATGWLAAQKEFAHHVKEYNLNFKTGQEYDYRFEIWN